ncbi:MULTISPECIES: YjjG family noncanonical pyrimidine nucleotidase [Exiguobacterium]|uniref:YjjG family noncanonical pyrimidine nucleotidase n=1 Tax=Exiguobacterium TaxID=33986 RepID=UPI00047DFFD5|nr:MULTISPECIES: YjjG family noncanonical pyrimidine nucleotidase [Exiguobacterium]MCT4780609.1 YjjG family noncanonical pyrimidine nucleotidase [Exiguobacterium soli]
MNYTTLLFDIDHTLLDFDATERSALRQLFEDEQLEWTEEREARYRTINQSLWKALERGEVTRNEVITSRFVTFFAEQGRTVDGSQIDARYRTYLSRGTELIEGAIELLHVLKGKYQLYVVTNGVAVTQRARLRGSGLAPYFDGVFVSEETGYQKPMAAFFDYVFDRIPDATREQTMIIGDSLTADIQGGIMAGIATCWFNPTHAAAPAELMPTYTIERLDQLVTLLGTKEVVRTTSK